MEPPSKPPTPPRPRITELPDLGDNQDNPQRGVSPIDFDEMTPSQVYDLNQLLQDESVTPRPLIDKIVPMSELRAEYENGSPSFLHQIDWLQKQGYNSIRRTRGDGDCFYRSAAFAYVERLMQDPDPDMAVGRALSTLESTLPMLKKVGFESFVYEDFYASLASLVRYVVDPDDQGNKLTPDYLLREFQLAEVSNSIVVYLRLVTSAQIRLAPEDFQDVLLHPETGEQVELRLFCEHFVEANGKEADHVQMVALCRALQLNIDVAYLDGRRSDGVVEFIPIRCTSDEGAKPLTLLYRPGHYDILVSPEH